MLGATGRASGLITSTFGVASGDRPAERLSTPIRKRWHPQTIGHSVEGRPITMYANLMERPRATVMVISALHGDERGAGAIGREITRVPLPDGVNAFAIPIANPDGWERGTRNNANDVDINRNFPWGWLPYDGGPTESSEPETNVMMGAIYLLQPDLVVWVHQPLEYVAPISVEARPYAQAWAEGCGLRTRNGVLQHGGGETWCAMQAGLPSMLVEARTNDADPDVVAAHRRGFESLLAVL